MGRSKRKSQSLLRSYGKVFSLGHRYTQGLLDEACVVQEKIDGSNIAFGVFSDLGADLHIRSRGGEINQSNPQALFLPSVKYIQSVRDRIVPGLTYYGEAMCGARHNKQSYERAPDGHVVLFDVYDNGEGRYLPQTAVHAKAMELGMTYAPIIFIHYPGSDELTQERVTELLGAESILGGAIEGFVVKRNATPLTMPSGDFVRGKVVSPQFRETAKHKAPKAEKHGPWEVISSVYGTERRWEKVVERMRAEGLITDTPADIGPVMEHVVRDVIEEDGADILEMPFFRKGLKGALSRGLPQWYKDLLMQGVVS